MYLSTLRTTVIVTGLLGWACAVDPPRAPPPADGRAGDEPAQPSPEPQPPEPPPGPEPPPPSCPPPGLNDLDPGFCTPACPCDEGQGGCVADDGCQGELVCSSEAELGWLRRCVAPVAVPPPPSEPSGPPYEVGAPCIEPGDCLSNNCGCAGASNILTCLAAAAQSRCSLTVYDCDPETTGDHGASCAEVPAETWRCVSSAGVWPGHKISQVCRNGKWLTYEVDPASCDGCCGDFSVACAAP